MSRLLRIQSLTLEEARSLLRDALLAERPTRALYVLIASIDWSTVDGSVPDEVAALFGEAEGLVTDYTEFGLGLDELVRAIQQLTQDGSQRDSA